MRNVRMTICVVVIILSAANIASATTVRGVDIDFVTIGNAGNTADTGGTPGSGAVSYEYRIGKYEVTNGQWDSFVTAAGLPTGDPSDAYDASAWYTGDNIPTQRVSWYETAQFCNYLTSGDKSLGAYQFSGNNTNPGDFLGIDRDSAVSAYGIAYEPPTIEWPPDLQVGPWVVMEDHHRWIPADEVIALSLKAIDPCDLILAVEFSWSVDGTDWMMIDTDMDGSEPSLTTLPDVMQSEGDGWAAMFDPSMIPPPTGPCTTIQLRGRAQMVDSFFDVYAEIAVDHSPPDAVEVITEMQGDMIVVDVNPNPIYPEDIAFVLIEVERKPEEFVKGIPPLNQLNDNRQYGGGYHSAPTATASCLKYFEGEYDGNIAGGLSGDDLTDALAGYQGCNDGGKGTYFGEWVTGITKWINDHGGGYTVRAFDHFDWDTARDELERGQDVLLRLQWPGGGGHALTLNSIHNTTDEIDLMDPYGGTISYGDFDPASGRLSNFEGASGNSGTFTHMIIICPEETAPDPGPNPHPGPDPGPIPIPAPDPGKYFVRVTVVDTCYHAATFISIVETSCSDCADYNHDGSVTAADLEIFAKDWLWVGPSGGHRAGDLDCNGIVRLDDFAIFAAQWLTDTLCKGI